MENKAADKAIGARVTSQPIVFRTKERSRNGQPPLTHNMQSAGRLQPSLKDGGVTFDPVI